MAEAAFPPVSELVPHEPPMLLVDELVEWSPDVAIVRATIRAGGPFVSGEQMPATILLEYMAQAIAVANGMAARVDGREAEIGLLLGTRELELGVEALAVGDELELRVEREFSDGRLARYACRTTRGGEELAAAVINVMVATTEELQP